MSEGKTHPGDAAELRRRAEEIDRGEAVQVPALISKELVLRAAKVLIPGQPDSFWSIQNGRVQKWRNNQRERDLGVYPWRINTIVTSACEDSDGNLIVGTLGEGVFWLGADANWRHIPHRK